MKTYSFGPDSEISITAHAPLHATHAKSRKVTGEFTAELVDGAPNGDVSGWAEVELGTFKSGNRLVEMNTLRHIEAKKHPRARFEILSMALTGTSPTRVDVAGTMDFHGVSVEIDSEPTVTVDGDAVTVEGAWKLRQSDFGLKPPRLAMLKVEDEIDVTYRLVAQATG